MAGTVYATQAQLKQLGISPAAIANVASGDIDVALQAASDRISEAFPAQWKLPLTQWSMSITEKTCEIAAYKLLSVRGYNPAAGADPIVRLNYEDAMKWIEMVAKGLLTPDVTDSSTMPVEGQPSFLPLPISSRSRGWTDRGGAFPGCRPRGPFVAS